MRILGPILAGAASLSALGAAEPASYYTEVRPLLQVHCSGCHQPANKLSGLDITTYEGILKGGAKHGSALVKGTPDNSPLVSLVTGKLQPRMPMGGAELAKEPRTIRRPRRRHFRHPRNRRCTPKLPRSRG